MGQLRSPGGAIVDVPDDQAESSIAQGYEPVSQNEAGTAIGKLAPSDSGALGTIGAGATSTLSGLTLGASDVALKGLLSKGQFARVAEDRAANPTVSGVGQFAGSLLPAVVAPESLIAKTPAGLTSSLGSAIVEGTGGVVGKSLAGRVVSATAGAAAEGALYGGGDYLSQVALENKPLSAEGFVGGMGRGALFAAPVGAGFTLAGAALTRARSLFPGSTISPEAGRVAAQDAKSALTQSIADGDQMVQAAKQKIELANAHAGMAEAGQNLQVSQTATADPLSSNLQGQAAVDTGQLADAVQAYETSKIQLDNWVRAESTAEPDLDAILGDIAPPSVQTGVRKGPYIERPWPPELPGRAPRPGESAVEAADQAAIGELDNQSLEAQLAALKPGSVQSRDLVPVGEFAKPGKGGIKTPEELEEAVRKAGERDSTRELRIGTRPQLSGISAPALAGAENASIESLLSTRGASEDATAVGRKRPLLSEPTPIAAQSATEAIAPAPGPAAVGYQVKRVGRPSEGKFEAIGSDGSTTPVSRADMADWLDSMLPPGFNPGPGLETHRDFSIERELPANSGEVKDNAVYIAKPSDLADHGIYGNEIHPDHATSMAAARKRDVRLAPIQVDVTPDGKWYIEDGNHRLNEAAKTNAEVAIEFRPRDPASGWEPQPNARDISGRLKESLPPKLETAALPHTPIGEDYDPFAVAPPPRKAKPIASPNDDLEALLNGTKAKLDAGESLQSIGAPSVADYAAGKAVKTAENAKFFREAAIAKHEIPTYESIGAQLEASGGDYVDMTLPASKINERGYYEMPGGNTDQVRMAKAKQAIAEGQRDAVKLNVSPTGKITVTDGRHRLAAAIEANAPVKVKWSTGFEPAPSDVLIGGPKANIGSEADTTLESLLRGTKQGLDSGASMRDINAPRVGGAKRAASQNEDIASLLGERAKEPTKRIVKGIDEFRQFLGEHFGIPEGYEAAGIHEGVPELRRAGEEPTVFDRSIKGEMAKASDDAAIERALRKHNGKNKNIGPDLATAAKVIGDHEAASAKLADLLGEEAPASARAQAQAYHNALGAQADAAGGQAAQAAQQLRDKAIPRTMVDPELRQQMQRILDDKAIEGMTGSAAPPAPKSGMLGRAKNAATALEVLHSLGVGVPAISSIPVIGPILGVYLKARAVLGILGRKGGNVGRSTETVIAGTASATRERIIAATQTLLEKGGKGMTKAAPHTASAAVILGDRLFPGGENPQTKDIHKLFAARMDELARATPDAIHAALTDRIHTSDPAMSDAIIAQTIKGMQFLQSKAPKQTILPGMLPGDGHWQPGKVAIEQFARYVQAVNDPASVIEGLAKGKLDMEGAETLRAVYPQLFAEAQQTLLQSAPKLQQTLPYAHRMALFVMYQIPLDGTMMPAHMQYLGAQPAPAAPSIAPAAPTPSAAPAITGPLTLGTQTMTSLDKRAGA